MSYVNFPASSYMVEIMDREDPNKNFASCKNKRVQAIAMLGMLILSMVAFPIALPIAISDAYENQKQVKCIAVALDIPLAVILYFPIMAIKTVQLALAALIHPAIAFKSV